ncbi:MAG: hypothetical protein U0P45_06835 [Acidimicrobiales bacterium]
MDHGVVLVALHQLVDRTVERGGEEDGLAVRSGLVEEPLHVGEEAHVGHAVGLVDHRHLDVAQIAHLALDQVDQAAGGGDDDVDPGADALDLALDVGPAVHGEDAELPGEQAELLGHLDGKLPRGGQHQAVGPLGGGPGDAGDHRDAEGDGLARAGGRLA